MATLILKRSSANRASGEWNDDDYDVLTDIAVVGRIEGARNAGGNILDLEARLWASDGPAFNLLAQPPKSLGDGLLRIVLPYPFLQRRRKRQRFAGFKTEGTNEAEGRLRHVGGLYLEGGVAYARIEPGETHRAIVDAEVHECALVEGHAQRHVPCCLGKDHKIPQFPR